jgi:hypothetical protein
MRMNHTILWVIALMGAMLVSPASAGNISPNAFGSGPIGSRHQTPGFGTMCAGADNAYCNTGGINGQINA